MFNESRAPQPEQQPKEFKIEKGHDAQGQVIDFLACLGASPDEDDLTIKDSIIKDIEETEIGGENDVKRKIDAIALLGSEDENGLPCAIDFTGASKEKKAQKKAMNNTIPLVSFFDEETQELIYESIPHFIIDIDTDRWAGYQEMVMEKRIKNPGLRIEITNIVEKEYQKKFYAEMIGKMLRQANNLVREIGEEKRDMVLPYVEILKKEAGKYLTEDQVEKLSQRAA